jgi:hypothetical protein
MWTIQFRHETSYSTSEVIKTMLIQTELQRFGKK